MSLVCKGKNPLSKSRMVIGLYFVITFCCSCLSMCIWRLFIVRLASLLTFAARKTKGFLSLLVTKTSKLTKTCSINTKLRIQMLFSNYPRLSSHFVYKFSTEHVGLQVYQSQMYRFLLFFFPHLKWNWK